MLNCVLRWYRSCTSSDIIGLWQHCGVRWIHALTESCKKLVFAQMSAELNKTSLSLTFLMQCINNLSQGHDPFPAFSKATVNGIWRKWEILEVRAFSRRQTKRNHSLPRVHQRRWKSLCVCCCLNRSINSSQSKSLKKILSRTKWFKSKFHVFGLWKLEPHANLVEETHKGPGTKCNNHNLDLLPLKQAHLFSTFFSSKHTVIGADICMYWCACVTSSQVPSLSRLS